MYEVGPLRDFFRRNEVKSPRAAALEILLLEDLQALEEAGLQIIWAHKRKEPLRPVEKAARLANELIGELEFYALARLQTPLRYKELVEQRRILAVALRAAGFSFLLIGAVLRKDHTSIIHACKTANHKEKELAANTLRKLEARNRGE